MPAAKMSSDRHGAVTLMNSSGRDQRATLDRVSTRRKSAACPTSMVSSKRDTNCIGSDSYGVVVRSRARPCYRMAGNPARADSQLPVFEDIDQLNCARRPVT